MRTKSLLHHWNTTFPFATRKSSCVNARPIPPAMYHALSLVFSLGGGIPVLYCPGEYPSPVLAGDGTPVVSWPGGALGWDSPTWDWPSPLPETEVRHVRLEYLQKGHRTSGSIMGWRCAITPPSPTPECRQTHILWIRTFTKNWFWWQIQKMEVLYVKINQILT